MNRIAPVALTLLFLGLAGCGNKGSLVLPTAPVDAPPPVDAPADAPPEPETLNDMNQEPVEGDGSEGGTTAPPPRA